MKRHERIKAKIEGAMSITHLEIINESHNHNVPHNSETHFKVVIVSDAFKEKNRVARQRLINDILKDEFESGLHALTMRLFTNDEWSASDKAKSFVSPDCHGGEKK